MDKNYCYRYEKNKKDGGYDVWLVSKLTGDHKDLILASVTKRQAEKACHMGNRGEL